MHLAASNGDITLLSLLCDNGANIHEKDNVSALFTHLQSLHMFSSHSLLRQGGGTPVYSSACCGHIDAMLLLLNRGANVNELTTVSLSTLLLSYFSFFSFFLHIFNFKTLNNRMDIHPFTSPRWKVMPTS